MPAPVLKEPLNRNNKGIPTRDHILEELKKLGAKPKKDQKKAKIKQFITDLNLTDDAADKILDDIESYQL